MFRKAVIVWLMLVSLGCGAIGIFAASNRVTRGNMWEIGTFGRSDYYNVWIGCYGDGYISLSCVKHLDGPQTPWSKQGIILGWHYSNSIAQNQMGFYLRSRKAMVHFAIPLVISFLAALYPTLALYRGPLRRWRRRRRGLCVECGYDLTGNVTGICSECGTKL